MVREMAVFENRFIYLFEFIYNFCLPDIKLSIVIYTRNVRQTFRGLKTSKSASCVRRNITLPYSLGLEGGRISRSRSIYRAIHFYSFQLPVILSRWLFLYGLLKKGSLR